MRPAGLDTISIYWLNFRPTLYQRRTYQVHIETRPCTDCSILATMANENGIKFHVWMLCETCKFVIGIVILCYVLLHQS